MSNTTEPQDYCTLVSDSPFGFSFGAICAVHDENYGPNSSVSRTAADEMFYNDMINTCYTQYDDSALCNFMATVYYIGVRLFGGLFYEGPGGD